MQRPAGGLPAGWGELIDGLAEPGDIQIVKQQWGAFYGTGLDLQLPAQGFRNRGAWRHRHQFRRRIHGAPSLGARLRGRARRGRLRQPFRRTARDRRSAISSAHLARRSKRGHRPKIIALRPSPQPSPRKLALASLHLSVAASASGCGWRGVRWQPLFGRPLSHGERDRVRGVTLDYCRQAINWINRRPFSCGPCRNTQRWGAYRWRRRAGSTY